MLRWSSAGLAGCVPAVAALRASHPPPGRSSLIVDQLGLGHGLATLDRWVPRRDSTARNFLVQPEFGACEVVLAHSWLSDRI